MTDKKDVSAAIFPDPKPDVVNQQVVQILLDLLKEVRQRSSREIAEEIPEEVKRDIAFAAATFTLIDGGLKMETPLVVREISPVTGGTAGGLVVTISGTNFVPSQGPSPATVLFGGAVASNVAVLSATELQATTPARNAALVDVVVTTVGGTLRLPGAFEYQ